MGEKSQPIRIMMKIEPKLASALLYEQKELDISWKNVLEKSGTKIIVAFFSKALNDIVTQELSPPSYTSNSPLIWDLGYVTPSGALTPSNTLTQSPS